MSYRGIDSGRRSLVASLLRAIVVLLILAVIAGIVWAAYRISDEFNTETMEVREFEPTFNLTVREVFTDEVGLDNRSTTETRIDTDEIAGLQWFGGFGQVTGLVDSRPALVVRQFEVFEGDRPAVGDQVYVDHLAYRGDPETAHGIGFEEVSVPGPLGALPAWFIDGSSDTWAILVHDVGDRGREEFLRIIPTIVAADHPVLAISYRNDDDAPKTEGRRSTFGVDEIEDLEAAVQFAIDRGAENVVIMGYGGGGSIALSFAYDSPLASRLAGLILEAPMTDLEEEVYGDNDDLKIPGTDIDVPEQMTWLALRLAERRWGVDFDRTDYVARSGELTVPTLLIRNGADQTIDPAQSDRLASRRSDIVQLEDFETAGHNRGWNVDRERYERLVRDWLNQLSN